MRYSVTIAILALFSTSGFPSCALAGASDADSGYFERHIRPVLVKHCYECHSEEAQTREGGLLLDRESGWLTGGETGKAVVPGDIAASLLWKAVNYRDDALQMPPDGRLDDETIRLFRQWIMKGAPGPARDLGTTEFSRLGDQDYLFQKAGDHWAFQPVESVEPPNVDDPVWNRSPIDRFVFQKLQTGKLSPSASASGRILIRRLYYDLTGLPPTSAQVRQFAAAEEGRRIAAVAQVADDLMSSQAFGEHIGRVWLDVVRYADTDSSYRPDTRTPHYFPFAFTYRDYVIDAFNDDKRYDQFIKEQLAADLMGFQPSAPETAALGFMTVGPHATRSALEATDDWIDLTTRGLMGLTAACARCHDHKYEPIPTADYYSLYGIFASVKRIHHLDEKRLPVLAHYSPDKTQVADYELARAAIDKKIEDAGGKKARNNNRSVSQKIRETELAELLLFHPGAPAHTMIVKEAPKPVTPFILVRGDTKNRGEQVPRRFLRILERQQSPFSDENSGRLDLAERIASPDNPLTARVFVNRVWGMLMGSYLVATPSDFGLQGTPPTHPELLDWLTSEFMRNNWSTKWLVRTIVLSRTYQQRSTHRPDAAAVDSENALLWRANRKRLSIEAIRDSILSVSDQMDMTSGGHPQPLWSEDYSKRRAVYGYINRFNPDPTLRAFDFPSRMQTDAGRSESVVAQQALFTMNSPFVIDQAIAITQLSDFQSASSDQDRIAAVFNAVLQRRPAAPEIARMLRFVDQQRPLFKKPRKGARVTSPWPLVAQALLMSNEFQYVD